MKMKQHDAFQSLITLAKQGRSISYQSLSDQCGLGLDMRLEHDRDKIGKLLGAISTKENEQGRPLISVIVFRDDVNMPGEGFFKIANRLGRYSGSKNEVHKTDFFVSELKKCYQFWGDQP